MLVLINSHVIHIPDKALTTLTLVHGLGAANRLCGEAPGSISWVYRVSARCAAAVFRPRRVSILALRGEGEIIWTIRALIPWRLRMLRQVATNALGCPWTLIVLKTGHGICIQIRPHCRKLHVLEERSDVGGCSCVLKLLGYGSTRLEELISNAWRKMYIQCVDGIQRRIDGYRWRRHSALDMSSIYRRIPLGSCWPVQLELSSLRRKLAKDQFLAAVEYSVSERLIHWAVPVHPTEVYDEKACLWERVKSKPKRLHSRVRSLSPLQKRKSRPEAEFSAN